MRHESWWWSTAPGFYDDSDVNSVLTAQSIIFQRLLSLSPCLVSTYCFGRLPQRTIHIHSLLWWWHIKSLGNGTLISRHCQWLLFNDYNGIWGEYLHCFRASAMSWTKRVLLTRYLVEYNRSIKQSIPFEINLWCSVSYGLSTYSNT